MKVQEISSGIEELESNEDLARVAGEALQCIAKRGRKAFEALFEMLDSDGDSAEEIDMFFGEWADKRAREAEAEAGEEDES